jgi:hypothetical protein
MSDLAMFSLHQTWKSLPDSHEVAKDLPNALITNVDATLEKLATTNLFYIARRVLKDTNQEVELLDLLVSFKFVFSGDSFDIEHHVNLFGDLYCCRFYICLAKCRHPFRSL